MPGAPKEKVGFPLASSSSSPATGTAAARSGRVGSGRTRFPWPPAGTAGAEPVSAREKQGGPEWGRRWARDRGRDARSRFGSPHRRAQGSGHGGCLRQPPFRADGAVISSAQMVCWNKGVERFNVFQTIKTTFSHCSSFVILSPAASPSDSPLEGRGFSLRGRGENQAPLRSPARDTSPTVPLGDPLIPFSLVFFSSLRQAVPLHSCGSDPLLLSPLPRSFRQRGQRSGRASSPQPRWAPAAPGTVGQRGNQAQPRTLPSVKQPCNRSWLLAVKPARSFEAKAGKSQRCGVGRGLQPPCPPRFGLASGYFIPRLRPRGIRES